MRHKIVSTPVPERETWPWARPAAPRYWRERVRELLNFGGARV